MTVSEETFNALLSMEDEEPNEKLKALMNED